MPSVATSLNIEIYFKITEAVWAGGDQSVFEKMMETWSHWAYSPSFDWWVCVFVCYGSLIARKEFWRAELVSLFFLSLFILFIYYCFILPCSFFFLIFHYIFTNITIKKKITNPTQKSGSKSKYANIKNKEKSMYNFNIIKKKKILWQS